MAEINEQQGQEFAALADDGISILLRRQGKLEAEIERLEDKLAQAKADTQLLDYLQAKLGRFSGRVICRWSVVGRGWRLHETNQVGLTSDVRTAIRLFMRGEKSRAGGQPQLGR